MSNEAEFADGLIVKAPRNGAPDYVIGSLSIKREELIAWLSAREGEWVNLEMKRAQSGKWYAVVDNWKPNQDGQRGTRTGSAPSRSRNAPPAPTRGNDPFPDDSDIPFISSASTF